ncbi:polysaccharide deacetylase family protein [Microbacterium sp. W1N]|uniref:polysaccharide deacetylase family protein n=1 Tax=Microbacterium festucae TaxID=2977531 RepID=UPI0021C200B6|nr:polysaccharide deacetylase family protein [Microbacterium festucae]MCT9818985.1 polysaccharide deacetylase family protein [Microbacterium festucae]
MTVEICFHGIGVCEREREAGEARYWMPEAEFLRVLDALVGLPDVTLSFDDGNRSDIEIGLPALQERGLRATFFALAGRLDDAASLHPDDLRELAGAGMTVGTHGWDHIPWRGLTDHDAHRELIDARGALAEAAGTDVRTAALPLGRYDRRLLARLRGAGYDAVYSSDRLPFHDGTWLRARYSVTASDTPASVQRIIVDRSRSRDVRNRLVGAVKRLR